VTGRAARSIVAWLADVEVRAIEQRVLGDGAWGDPRRHAGVTVCESAVFPGLRVPVAEVFRSA
jgi:hypothetical protein